MLESDLSEFSKTTLDDYSDFSAPEIVQQSNSCTDSHVITHSSGDSQLEFLHSALESDLSNFSQTMCDDDFSHVSDFHILQRDTTKSASQRYIVNSSDSSHVWSHSALESDLTGFSQTIYECDLSNEPLDSQPMVHSIVMDIHADFLPCTGE